MIDAKPINFALALLINFTHSILDLPVVITSSTIRTLEFFLIKKPLLSENLPLTLSQKIVTFFKIFAEESSPIENQWNVLISLRPIKLTTDK